MEAGRGEHVGMEILYGIPLLFTGGLFRDWQLADGCDVDSGDNDGLKWRIAERYRLLLRQSVNTQD